MLVMATERARIGAHQWRSPHCHQWWSSWASLMTNGSWPLDLDRSSFTVLMTRREPPPTSNMSWKLPPVCSTHWLWFRPMGSVDRILPRRLQLRPWSRPSSHCESCLLLPDSGTVRMSECFGQWTPDIWNKQSGVLKPSYQNLGASAGLKGQPRQTQCCVCLGRRDDSKGVSLAS